MSLLFGLLTNISCRRTFSNSRTKALKGLKPLPILNSILLPIADEESAFGNDFQQVMNFLNRVSGVLGITIPRPEIVETTKNTSHKMYEVLAHNSISIPEKFKFIFKDKYAKLLDSITFCGKAKTISEARQKALFHLADCLHSSLKSAELFLPTTDQDPRKVLPFINFNLTEAQRSELTELIQTCSDDENISNILDSTKPKSVSFNEGSHANYSREAFKNIERPEPLQGKLPIYRHYKEIVGSVEGNQVTIVSATTGSGKTTQIPKFILHHFEAECPSIIVTQPRRVAAISLADRVAHELGEGRVGYSVGYSVRFDSVLPNPSQPNICNLSYNYF